MDIKYFLIIFIVTSTVFLGLDVVVQYIYDIHPCSLCIYQRYPWIIILSFGLIGLFLKNPIFIKIIVTGIFFCLLVIIALSVYHVGVEQKWWVNQFIFTNTIDCSRIQWSLFGISLAGFNAIISSLLAIIIN